MERLPRGRLGSALSQCGSVLQVALDVDNLWRALSVAAALPRSPAVALEAGTPLVKAFGADAVRGLRGVAGERPVIADTKTVDAGALEVAIVAGAGADAATLLSVASDATVEAALREASQRGVALYLDLMTSRDPEGDAVRAEKLGIDVLLLHLGVDVQAATGERVTARRKLVEELSQSFKGAIAVAGGVKPGEAGELAAAGASIIIIGGAITRAPDPGEAAKQALESLAQAGTLKC